MDWFRWWHGTVSDPKLRWVARRSGVPLALVIALWAALLEASSNVAGNGEGVTRGTVVGFDCDAHDAMFDVEEGTCARILAIFKEKGMVLEGRIANWEKRQPKREDAGNSVTGAKSAAQRKREQRERERAARLTGSEIQCHEVSRDVTEHHGREDESREEESTGPRAHTADLPVAGRGTAGMRAFYDCDASVFPTGRDVTSAVTLSRALRNHGVQCASSNPDLAALVEQGVAISTVIAAVEDARLKKPDGDIPLRYVVRIIEGWARQSTPNVAGAAVPQKGHGQWWLTNETALAKAKEVSVGSALPGESETAWHARIRAAIDTGGKSAVSSAPAQRSAPAAPAEQKSAPSDASRVAASNMKELLKRKAAGGGLNT